VEINTEKKEMISSKGAEGAKKDIPNFFQI